MRRPRGSLPISIEEFILKVTPQNSGSKHWCWAPRRFHPGV